MMPQYLAGAEPRDLLPRCGGVVRTISTVLIGFALWGPPVAAIIANRVNPDIGTALGVPYAFVAGLLGAVTLTVVLALAAWRWPGVRPNYLAVGAMMGIAIALFALANRGILSVVG